MEIVRIFLFSIFLFIFSFLLKVYRLRKKDLVEAYQISTMLQLMVVVIDIGLSFLVFSSMYNIFKYGFSLGLVARGLAVVLPRVLCNVPSIRNSINKKISRYIYHKRVRQYLSCPHCKEGLVFYRNIENSDSVCYYLIDKKHQQVFLGLNEPDNRLLSLFLSNEHSFGDLVNHYHAHLVPDYYDFVILADDNGYLLEEDCYCTHCLNKVNSDPVELGMVLF